MGGGLLQQPQAAGSDASSPGSKRRRLEDAKAATVSEGARPALCDLKTIVVNLERRPDRLKGCADRLSEQCAALAWTRFAATDGRASTIPTNEVSPSWNTARNCVYQRVRSLRKGWDDLQSYEELVLKLSPGERGCASSHVRAWRLCVELDERAREEDEDAADQAPGQPGGRSGRGAHRGQPLVVLEDDAAPTGDFQRVLESALDALPADAHLLYLGYSQAADWRREISPDLAESEYVWTTVGYIIWPAGARVLLDRLPVDQPVDNWLACLNAAGDLKAYCTRPKIVRQVESWNVNSDVAHSDECGGSDIKHSDMFYWGPVHKSAAGGRDLLPGLERGTLPAMLGALGSGSLWEDGSDISEDSETQAMEDEFNCL